MSKIIAIILACILFVGCSSTPPKEITFDDNLSHPERPTPVKPYKFDFQVIHQGNMEETIGPDDVFVAVTFDENLTFREFLEDIKRYILEANGLICYYRQDLEEDFCENQKRYIDAKTRENQQDENDND